MKLFLWVLFLSFLCFPDQSFGQRGWLGGVKGGISIPKLRAPGGSGNNYSDGFETVIGPQMGILAEYRFNSCFSLQTEFNYVTQGGKKSGDQRIRTGDFNAYIPVGLNLPDYLYANFNNKISLVYFELPVMAKFSLKTSSPYRFSFFGGPYIGYLMKADGEASGQSRIYTDPEKRNELTFNGIALGNVDFTRKEDIISQLNRTNIGLQGGTSIEYSTKLLNYFMSLSGNLGLRRLQKDPNFGDNKIGGLALSFGVTRKL